MDSLERQFYIDSMEYNLKLKFEYDKMKIESILQAIFGKGKK
ncbi:hypothetical protein [Clostridium sporogenes]|nr:hypothetical protein [Clostridium sporogenes]